MVLLAVGPLVQAKDFSGRLYGELAPRAGLIYSATLINSNDFQLIQGHFQGVFEHWIELNFFRIEFELFKKSSIELGIFQVSFLSLFFFTRS